MVLFTQRYHSTKKNKCTYLREMGRFKPAARCLFTKLNVKYNMMKTSLELRDQGSGDGWMDF